MKTRILSLAILFIALFSFNNAFAQNPHFVGDVCYNAETGLITGKVAGVGNKIQGYSITIEGLYSCQNRGDNYPGPWQNLKIEGVRLTPTTTPGTYSFSQRVSVCKKNWTTYLNASAILLYNTVEQDRQVISTNCE